MVYMSVQSQEQLILDQLDVWNDEWTMKFLRLCFVKPTGRGGGVKHPPLFNNLWNESENDEGYGSDPVGHEWVQSLGMD